MGKALVLKLGNHNDCSASNSHQLRGPQVTSLGLHLLVLYLNGFIRRQTFSQFEHSIIRHKHISLDFQGDKIYWRGNAYTDKDKEQSKGPNVKRQMAGTSRKCYGHHRTSGNIILNSLPPPVNSRMTRIIILDTTLWGCFDNKMKTK